MRAAAEFYGVAVAHHADVIAVLLSEESHSTHGAGLGYRHMALLVESHGLTHTAVGKTLDSLELFGGKLLEVREVEAEHVGRHV